MEKYSYQTNDTDFNKYDIFEVGGEIIANSVPWEFVEKICSSLNAEPVLDCVGCNHSWQCDNFGKGVRCEDYF